LQEIHGSFCTDLLPGRGTLIPIEAFQKLGLFDEVNFPHYAADEEFANRCKKYGYKLLVSSNSFVFSEVDATGMKNMHQTRNFKYWGDLFTSIRSPVNLKRRWLWAKLNSPVPIFYFSIDFFRIVGSQIKNKFK
jgi:GT2 family glycosyltransferase